MKIEIDETKKEIIQIKIDIVNQKVWFYFIINYFVSLKQCWVIVVQAATFARIQAIILFYVTKLITSQESLLDKEQLLHAYKQDVEEKDDELTTLKGELLNIQNEPALIIKHTDKIHRNARLCLMMFLFLTTVVIIVKHTDKIYRFKKNYMFFKVELLTAVIIVKHTDKIYVFQILLYFLFNVTYQFSFHY